MTNPIAKAVVKVAVNMGYGKKSDYKGSSVADVLEKFAAFAKDKGGSGGYEPYIVEVDGMGTENMTTDAVFADAKAQFLANKPVLFRIEIEGTGIHIFQAITLIKQGEKESLLAFAGGDAAILFNDDGSISTT